MQIAERYNVSLAMVKKLLQQRRRTGDIAPRHLRRMVAEHPDMTLEELRDGIGVACTPQAVHYALARMGLPLKKRRSFPPS